MQELAGRLTALDAEAIQTLKVISYFDALVANGAGLESLVRGAATVTGVAAGAQSSTRNIRIDAAGRRSPSDDEPDAWPSAATPGGGRVWIERAGEPYANDAMVLERLALSVAIVAGARGETFHASVEELIDASVSAAERVSAARRLGLDLESPIRVWATPPDVTVAGHSALVPTQHGLVRAVITSVACTDLGVLTRMVVDVGETSGVELELSSSSTRSHGGLSCPTLMPG